MKKLFILISVICFWSSSCQKVKKTPTLKYNILIRKGEEFYENNKDSSFYYFNKYASVGKDSLQLAIAFNYIASLQSDAGDIFGSQESLISSLKLLNRQNPIHFSCLASDYNELGVTSLNLLNTKSAINYFNEAVKFSKDKQLRLIIRNNMAKTYQDMKDYPRAISIYQNILTQTKVRSLPYARVLTNLTMAKWYKNPEYPALQFLHQALEIRERKNDLAGENSSFSKLADYHFKSNPDSSYFYSKKMYNVADQLHNPEDKLSALKKLIRTGPTKLVGNYFETYERINDSLQKARNAAKNQFALIRYESEKNKTENLKLQKDNAVSNLQIFKQRIFLYGLFILFTAAIFTGIWRYRKRKQKILEEAETRVRENQLKTSKKVHDVVANGLYSLMAEIAYNDLEKNEILDEINYLYTSSRNISYLGQSGYENNFAEKLGHQIELFSTGGTKVAILGLEENLWTGTTPETKFEINCVMRELMVNMKKHSQAQTVVVAFERINDKIYINYEDDGIGFTKEFKNKNGLTNTGNRIESISGVIKFDSQKGKGVLININFPVKQT